MSLFNETDLQQFSTMGTTAQAVTQQIVYFKEGFPFLHILRPATLGNGLIGLTNKDAQTFQELYEKSLPGLKVEKFVPASGAASRMFKSLFAFMESSLADASKAAAELETNPKLADVKAFFSQLEDFAFFPELKQLIAQKGDKLQSLLNQQAYGKILEYFLTEKGLDYGNLPKGLLAFHAYPQGPRTPLEEHLVEGANYCKQVQGHVHIHFTVSPEHESKFREKVAETLHLYQDHFGVEYVISFSAQKPATDTVAVDLDNQPFRNDDHSLLFRPGGHGALLDNLNDISADFIFIKNIDNVVPDHLKRDTVVFKKVLGGVLFHFQQQIFSYLRQLDNTSEVSAELVQEIGQFLAKDLCTEPHEAFAKFSLEEKVAYLVQKLNRPLRACGMVKNEGEPGGGPFWAKNTDGTTSLQVVESAQIDMGNPDQKQIAESATHFNPVDIVCAVKDYQGNKFDLLQFRDPLTGFISQKSKDGRELKAQELPGLWNGSMSDWNTIFVEVPIATFNPVKTVNDLLRPQHQGKA